MDLSPIITTFVQYYFLFPCSVSLYVTSFVWYSLVFTTFLRTEECLPIYYSCVLNVSPYAVSMFALHWSCFPKAFSDLVHSYDTSTLLSVSLYVSMFIRYKSCLFNVYPYVRALLVVFLTFLRNLLSYRNSLVRSAFFRTFQVLTELLLSNEVFP